MTATESPVATTAVPRRPATGWWRSLRQDRMAFGGAVILGVLAVLAIFGPLLEPDDPNATDLFARYAPPVFAGGTWEHVLGADGLGRDVLSRVVAGAQMTLFIGVSVVIISGVVGVALGLLAGYRGGWVDTVIMRVADAQLAFPGLLLVLLVVAFVGPSVGVIIGVLSLYGWMIHARLVRSMVLQLRQTPAVQSAELVGCPLPRILVRHLLPNLYAPLLAQAILELARVVLAEASLSYLGLGLQPPHASWGLMIAENQGAVRQAWWPIVFPGVALALTVLAVNLVANWLRVQTDPQQRERRFARRLFRTLPAAGLSTTSTVRVGGKNLLEVEDLDVRFHTMTGEVDAVRHASFSIAPGETVAIVGESGSGKSTTGLALMDLIGPPGRVEHARMTWRGEPLTAERLRTLRGNEIGMVFQDPMTSLNPLVPIGRQVAEVLVKHKGMPMKDALDRAAELFAMVGIPSPRERLRQLPHELSGGLRQRVLIAAALAPEPALLIADEPTTALDATIQAQILDLVTDLQERLGVALLLITHDLGVVARISDRVIVMYGGRIVEEAGTFDLFARPRHRYTEALLRAVPRLEDHRGRLPTIPGYPPGRRDVLPGCAFAPRCAHATQTCRTDVPETTTDALGRFACWHPREEQ
ncbi:dipeptide/oligopeptide/nickel ABC transporter permease/ATP-binding protein [Pseudonocardia benzenivorans]|uniref:Dipeptide/oligopeptide/nickel ABC transporter permease/ATP-binding protein n=3 Tax=Pseudonocardia benzenivorans TaxID=228005 RepID=A0ABW3VBL4_9PSEU